MADWRTRSGLVLAAVKRLPPLFWAVAGVLAVSLAAVLALEAAGPPFAVLDEGLSPADGGKVIAQLQKLGIPYELQAEGNVILVPAPQLAQARLQLGQSETPGGDAGAAWARVEDAPMTASDLAQSTMAQRALELELQSSIENLAGVRAAEVFLALPPQTPFLADQPKPTAAVVIQAEDGDAAAQGRAIAQLVAGAVPGLSASAVTVETTSGVTVYPAGDAASVSTQFATVAAVETQARARIAGLLIPLVGAGNFETDVSANLDFTETHTHQVTYGPVHQIAHETESMSDRYGSATAALGIPGALSNEPPPATSATTASPGTTAGATTGATPGATTGATPDTSKSAAKTPEQTSHSTDATYVTDQSDSDITLPDWQVKSIAVSVVLDKARLGNVTTQQVQSAIAAAFAYPAVKVSVLAAPFVVPVAGLHPHVALQSAGALTQGLLELLAAVALLFGLALPVGRRLATVTLPVLQPPPRPLPVVLPPRDFSSLRDQAAENVPGVARLLQAWAEDSE